MRVKRIILFVLFSLALSMMDSSQSQWIIKRSPHFTYYYMEECPQAQEINYQMSLSESHYEKMTRLLGVTMDGKINYYYYPSKEMKGKMTGNFGSGHTNNEKREVHSIYPYHPHEIVHVIASYRGHPPAILSEGLAVCYGWDAGWQGKSTEWWTQQFLDGKKFIHLSSLLDSTSFRRWDDQITYPEAGSFVRYLIESHGIAQFMTLYSSASNHDIGTIMTRIYGKTIAEIENDWLDYASKQVSMLAGREILEQADFTFGEAQSQFQAGNFSDARASFLKAKQLYEKSNGIFETEQGTLKIKTAEEYIIECDKGNRADSLFREGRGLYDTGDYSGAKSKFEQALLFYEEIDNHKAGDAKSMMLKCDDELNRTPTTTVQPVTQKSQGQVNMPSFPFVFLILLFIILKGKANKG